jgi:hypothetical protein
MGAVVFALSDTPLYVSVPTGFFGYIALVIALKVLRPEELTYIKKLISQKLGIASTEDL